MLPFFHNEGPRVYFFTTRLDNWQQQDSGQNAKQDDEGEAHEEHHFVCCYHSSAVSPISLKLAEMNFEGLLGSRTRGGLSQVHTLFFDALERGQVRAERSGDAS